MKIAHIHFYVENAKASRDWFVNYMGFQALASSTSRHTQTTVVKSGAVYIVLSSPLTSASPVAQFLRLHPPGVADIAFVVSDLEGVMEKAVANGATVLQPVQQQPLAQGGWKWAKIAAWGSVSHTLIEESFTTAPPLVSVSGTAIEELAAGSTGLSPDWLPFGDRIANIPQLPEFADSEVTT